MDETYSETVDEWFIESLKIYKDLHVYQLEQPTRVLEWTAGKTICVAGYSTSKNEILELLLPLKLFADEKKGLCAQRDFKVINGGFTNGPVACLKHIPGTRCVVSNDGISSKLHVWDIGGEDNDVFKRRANCIESTSVSEKGSKIAAGLSSEPRVLHGSEIRDIQLTDLSSGKSLYAIGTNTSDLLSSLKFVEDSVFLACSCNGDLYVGDTRTNMVPRFTKAGKSDASYWCMDVSTHMLPSNPTSSSVAMLSSSCQVLVSDLRDLSSPVGQAQLPIQCNGFNHDFLNVTWAPVLDNCIAVSGFNGVVQIFDTSAWRPEMKEVQPLFEHQGHMMSPVSHCPPALITSHIWHPRRPQTVISAATDGSVHVWDWVDKRAACC